MKSFLQKLFRRPEFLFRPAQLFRRILWEIKSPKQNVHVKLPWGLTMNVSPEDRIGASIIKTGTYDTAVLECLYRLTDQGETCLDIGANYGLMTGLLARASGPNGNRYGDAAGHTCLAVSGPVERVVTLETGKNDREANMWVFTKGALDLLHTVLEEMD